METICSQLSTTSFHSPKVLLLKRVFVASCWSDSALLPNSLLHFSLDSKSQGLSKALTNKTRASVFLMYYRVNSWYKWGESFSDYLSTRSRRCHLGFLLIWAKCWYVTKITKEDCRDGDIEGIRNERRNL